MIVYMTHDEDKGLLFTMQTEREWMTLTIVPFDSALSSMNHLMVTPNAISSESTHVHKSYSPHKK